MLYRRRLYDSCHIVWVDVRCCTGPVRRGVVIKTHSVEHSSCGNHRRGLVALLTETQRPHSPLRCVYTSSKNSRPAEKSGCRQKVCRRWGGAGIGRTHARSRPTLTGENFSRGSFFLFWSSTIWNSGEMCTKAVAYNAMCTMVSNTHTHIAVPRYVKLRYVQNS